ncbi:MAG: hypothetical protein OEL69_03890, partial [Nitrosopumilus sp.]|nr:hypothetical protein [Nitrosopumilus sp.]
MALVEKTRKGGRYTQKEQEERRIHVYHLHFEENKSAVKIAQLLDVNCNTINDDITYWHSQLASEMNAQDLCAKMIKQIQRMEIQRDRLLDDLEEAVDFDEKIRIEKFISQIDTQLTNIFSKMILSGKTMLAPTIKSEIDKNEIRDFVRDLVLSNYLEVFSENDLKYDFIKRTRCDVKHAENVLDKMKSDGLVLCIQDKKYNSLSINSHDFSQTFNLGKFALMRGYVTINEVGNIIQKRFETEREIENDEKERKEKFVKKYG